MPKFDNTDTKTYNTGHYGFSAAKIDNLEACEYTLVTIVLDESGSTQSFKNEMESCVKEIINACRQSPRADFLLLRVVTFANRMTEIHGFMPLEQCNPDDYIGCYGSNNNGNLTALYDSAENAIKASAIYGEHLSEEDFDVNGIVFILTDGMDNESSVTEKEVKQALSDCITSEKMESIISVLIGVNVTESGVSQYLNSFNTNVGFTQYIELEKADSKTLAKLADFISKSISSQSQALGTGGASQSLVF
jgi:uncharacterized protein YegL